MDKTYQDIKIVYDMDYIPERPPKKTLFIVREIKDRNKGRFFRKSSILQKRRSCNFMKYIRTKDSIYKLEMAKEFGIEDLAIKQADTIEELCDEFVDTSELRGTNTGGWLYDELDTKNKCLVYYEHDERKTISLNEFDDLSKIYGAIFTDKGLIYVAKMNEKGELELL